MDTKRKIEESLALLNSIIAHPNKKQSIAHQASNTATDSLPGSAPGGTSPASFKKRVYLPPRPAVLDKLSRLSSSRPTLRDSIAASIAASAPSSNSSPSDPTAPTSVSSSVSQPCVAKTNAPLNPSKKKYMPWSREQFHERLETFKPSTWFDKPKIVSPVECAKRGWINKGNDRLECFGGCGGVVIVRVDQDQRKADHKQSQDSAGNDGGEPRADVIDDDGDADDMLYELGIEDNIYKFPVVSLSQARAELLDRVKFLTFMENDCLIEKIRHPLTQNQIESLESRFPDVASTKLLILSLFGWSTLDEQRMLFCKACHTRCTYIISSGFSGSDSSNRVGMDEDDIMEEEDEVAFDVVQSHKWYCYWVNMEQDSSHKEGWRTLFERLTYAATGKINGGDGSAESLQSGSSTAKIE
ncbi:hypothetical protein BGZ80_000752, partial [Entomortierella chlamydospora]